MVQILKPPSVLLDHFPLLEEACYSSLRSGFLAPCSSHWKLRSTTVSLRSYFLRDRYPHQRLRYLMVQILKPPSVLLDHFPLLEEARYSSLRSGVLAPCSSHWKLRSTMVEVFQTSHNFLSNLSLSLPPC